MVTQECLVSGEGGDGSDDAIVLLQVYNLHQVLLTRRILSDILNVYR